ncbi:hypothetical protein [Streptomyces sp. VRA16 Mangrove soil]|uniref:hypothetical protein n=1 Tax=Streptomyces sp. VRA16 Mangrove soil TaxID=2817434 RepID=UPI001A9E2C0E|nr:hypothetical protein [Streptomyces sp. VRA16 Mangrove soil]MBO1337276.1 hypothetical protein [Streptomyces sp. VRA16 Mangrove soil]
MPPATSHPVRSADEVNEQIRGLWLRAGGRLTAEQRAQYEHLVTEWAQAVRAGVVEAA